MSPEYYWVRVFELPIDSKKEVLKVLPNLFEEFINIENQKFYVRELSKNKYLSFAYDEMKIIEALKKSNLSMNQVKNIYFGQIELEHLFDSSKYIKIDGITLGYIDNKIVKIPSSMHLDDDNDANNTNINNLKFSNSQIYVNSSSKYIDTKSIYLLSSLLIFFALFTFASYTSNSKIINAIPEKITVVKKESKMLATTMQTKSVIKKFIKISKKQIEIREVFEYMLLFKKNQKGLLISMSYKNNNFIFEFKDISQKNIKRYINKRYKLNSLSTKDKITKVAFKI